MLVASANLPYVPTYLVSDNEQWTTPIPPNRLNETDHVLCLWRLCQCLGTSASTINVADATNRPQVRCSVCQWTHIWFQDEAGPFLRPICVSALAQLLSLGLVERRKIHNHWQSTTCLLACNGFSMIPWKDPVEGLIRNHADYPRAPDFWFQKLKL